MIKFLIFLLLVLLSQSDAKPRQRRFVNGLSAEVGSFPFVASLRYRTNNYLICGAAIISKSFLITAAHCIQNKTIHTMHVYAGSVDLYHGGTKFDIHELIVHENYTRNTLVNDIGLIRLTEPMRIGSDTEIINFLPSGLYVSPGDEVTVVGWGLLYYYKPRASKYTIQRKTNRLQYFDRRIFSDEECVKKANAKIGPNQMCLVGEDARGICYGDSGSPLVYTYGDNNFIIGVSSWTSPKDCTPDFVRASGYTNVSRYLDWIHAHMKKGEKRNLTENFNSEKSEKTHFEGNTANSQKAEETNSWFKKLFLNPIFFLASQFNSSNFNSLT